MAPRFLAKAEVDELPYVITCSALRPSPYTLRRLDLLLLYRLSRATISAQARRHAGTLPRVRSRGRPRATTPARPLHRLPWITRSIRVC